MLQEATAWQLRRLVGGEHPLQRTRGGAALSTGSPKSPARCSAPRLRDALPQPEISGWAMNNLETLACLGCWMVQKSHQLLAFQRPCFDEEAPTCRDEWREFGSRRWRSPGLATTSMAELRCFG